MLGPIAQVTLVGAVVCVLRCVLVRGRPIPLTMAERADTSRGFDESVTLSEAIRRQPYSKS